jgi:glycosyltransferase involved in cell wall biosynthesis
MSDRPDYVYPEKVCYEIDAADYAAYRPAADFINRYGYDVLSVQHEYGIFGGDDGAYLMSLVREAKMPIVTTLHTVLRDPTPGQKAVMDELLQYSERVIVMSRKAVGFLEEVHGTPADKVDLIPHGIPEITPATGREFRKTLGIDGPMLLTFGLLSPDKGVQYVIEAMPEIVRAHPGATYVIVGATHPHVRASAGESYRESLADLARKLGVENNVRFVDRFVTIEELVQYLGAMDIYITPYLNPKQITSGTLAYAVGAGKAVISTPYWYAQELLAEGRGMLVPFRNASAIAEAAITIQSDTAARAEMGRLASEYGKHMLWPQVGRRYLDSFTRAKAESAERLRELVQKPVLGRERLPDLRLDHLFDLSDDTGVFQHATFNVPNRSEGYCVDDNTRALLFTAMQETGRHLPADVSLLQSRYLAFLMDAYNPANGKFRNFMSYDRTWLEEAGSEDSQGRSLWGLGSMVHRCRNRGRRDVARSLFLQAAPGLYQTTSLRTWAYTILAADEYLSGYPQEESVLDLMETMAAQLWEQFTIHETTEWPWFERKLTYANARLPQSLLMVGRTLGNKNLVAAGMRSLSWLMELQTGPKGVFAPIGSDGFYDSGGERAFFDQQPVEAWCSVSACLTAGQISGHSRWQEEASRAFRWFLGENMLCQPVADRSSGGCHDGLHSERVNRNQGAESTLSYLCALAELREAAAIPAVAPVRAELHEIKPIRGAA